MNETLEPNPDPDTAPEPADPPAEDPSAAKDSPDTTAVDDGAVSAADETAADETAADETAAETPEERIERLEQKVAELRDRALRTAAEADNIRKRNLRELPAARNRGIADLSTSLLDVLDNLERALDSVPEADRSQGLPQGVKMVQELLVERLRDFEIQRIRTVGEAFDPHFHEALQEEVRDDVDPGTVVSELMPGYRMADQLLRAAKVLVARSPANPSAADESDEPMKEEGSSKPES